MLTKKELLKYKKIKGKFIPCFIDPACVTLQEFAIFLCDIFVNSVGKTRKEIENQVDEALPIFDVDSTVAQGLKKLCFDSLTFESSLAEKSIEFRANVFTAAFSCLQNFSGLSIEEYRKHVENFISLNKENIINKNSPKTAQNISELLYSDLPEFHKVTDMKSISTQGLLNRYNVALVQGLLFYSQNLVVTIPSVSTCKAQFRQLLRQIKFFQLVVFLTRVNDSVVITIDGPLSLFLHTQKYGFNLACFFPALLQMPQWQLSAQIELAKDARKIGELNLSQKDKLLSHYKNYSAYIPEEFSLFASSFMQKSENTWSICENADDFLFDGENYFCPDFAFRHQSGIVVYLELFHSWHAAALKHRIFAVDKKQPSFILLLGASKTLLKEPSLSLCVEQSAYFSKFGFNFRDVISVDKVLSLLGSALSVEVMQNVE